MVGVVFHIGIVRPDEILSLVETKRNGMGTGNATKWVDLNTCKNLGLRTIIKSS